MLRTKLLTLSAVTAAAALSLTACAPSSSQGGVATAALRRGGGAGGEGQGGRGGDGGQGQELRAEHGALLWFCLLYTSPSPRDVEESRMPSSA